jgi:hypothetical protein
MLSHDDAHGDRSIIRLPAMSHHCRMRAHVDTMPTNISTYFYFYSKSTQDTRLHGDTFVGIVPLLCVHMWVYFRFHGDF